MGLNVGSTYRHPRHGDVEVIDLRPGIKYDVRVRDQHADEFWIQSCELPEVFYQPGSEAAFVAQLQRESHSFFVRVPNDEELLRATEEYHRWCGEYLQEESVYLRPNIWCHRDRRTPTAFVREWRLTFKLLPHLRMPFRITPVGFSDNFYTRDTQQEQALLRQNGMVEINWISIIERLVRYGLRTTVRR